MSIVQVSKKEEEEEANKNGIRCMTDFNLFLYLHFGHIQCSSIESNHNTMTVMMLVLCDICIANEFIYISMAFEYYYYYLCSETLTKISSIQFSLLFFAAAAAAFTALYSFVQFMVLLLLL